MLSARGLLQRHASSALAAAACSPWHTDPAAMGAWPRWPTSPPGASHILDTSGAAIWNSAQQRATAKKMASKLAKMKLKAAQKHAKQSFANATPQQAAAHELLRKYGTDNPTMLISYYDDSTNHDRPWQILPLLWWFRRSQRRAQFCEEWVRSSVVWEQLKSKTGQTLINVVQHAQQLFVAVKQEVAAGRPSTKVMTSAVGAAFNEEAARRRNKGFKLQEWTLHRALRADDVRVLQLRILPADKVGKVVYFQATVQYHVHEKLTFSKGEKSVEHDPVWVLLKRVSSDTAKAGQQPDAPHGGWRLAARMRDQSSPSVVGAEVKAQIPPTEMKQRNADMWEAQKTALKAQRHTIAGWFAWAMLR